MTLCGQTSTQVPHSQELWYFLAFALAFAIKVPLFPLHTWLPDAHVEAPTAGSMILAGVLLKMGGYGFLRFAIPMFPHGFEAALPWLLGLSVIGIIYGSLVAMVQPDMKKLVAYSSVAHLGFVMLGMVALNRQGVLAWHVREGRYGDVKLDGLTLVALGEFEGNLWAGEAKAVMGMYLDEKADERQREALQAIFGGQAGGWPAGFAANIGEMRGMEFVPIAFEVAGDLATWRVEIPGRVVGRAEALSGPTTPPGKRVQTINPQLPAKSVADLIALAKKSPGKIRYGSGGPGSGEHFATVMFTQAAGINMLHVPYKGVAGALIDTIANEIQMQFAVYPAAFPHVSSGRLRARTR